LPNRLMYVVSVKAIIQSCSGEYHGGLCHLWVINDTVPPESVDVWEIERRPFVMQKLLAQGNLPHDCLLECMRIEDKQWVTTMIWGSLKINWFTTGFASDRWLGLPDAIRQLRKDKALREDVSDLRHVFEISTSQHAGFLVGTLWAWCRGHLMSSMKMVMWAAGNPYPHQGNRFCDGFTYGNPYPYPVKPVTISTYGWAGQIGQMKQPMKVTWVVSKIQY
jgi:hypothetical protein